MPLWKYDEAVFINCPFTPDYTKLFHAVVFATLDCGFVPVSALIRTGTEDVRIDKITDLIRDCRYGIHDLSATDPDPISGLPRFNMPLELGIFIGARTFGSVKQKTKGYLVLDTARYRYQQFCSDLGGQDPRAHGGDPHRAISAIRSWLRNETDTQLPGGKTIVRRYELFETQLPTLLAAAQLDLDEIEFNDLTSIIEGWLKKRPHW